MELPLGLIALAILVGPWVVAVVSFVRQSRLRRRVEDLAADLASVRATVDRALRGAMPTAEAGPEVAPAPPRAPAEAAAPTTAAPPTPRPPAAAPEAPPSRPPPPATGPQDTLEEKIALVWFTRIGALAVLAGAAYFLKYAVDNRWIGPAGRVALGALAGALALGFAEWIRPRARGIYVQAVQGTGIALLLASAYASHALYHLVPALVAFAAVGAVALAGGALAVRGRSEIVLALALLGGLLAPPILSTGEDRPIALFGYLLVLGALALVAGARLGFRVTPFLALAGTALLFAGWHDRFFLVHPGSPPGDPIGAPPGAYHAFGPRIGPLLLAAAFAALWLAFWARTRRAAPRAWSDAWLALSLALAHLMPWALLHDRPLAAGAAIVAAGLVATLFLDRAGRPLLHPAAAALGGLLLAASWDGTPADRHAWLAAAAAWAALHLGAVAHAWRVRGEAPAPARVAAAAVAGLGLAGFAIWVTQDHESVLRAAVVGAAGAAELGLGALAVRAARLRASVLLGAALGLFAGAAAFLLSGASITVVWAALAAVAAALAARDRDPWWLAGAALLFLAALARIAAVDLPGPARATSDFLLTSGQAGALRPAFLLNARTLALFATAAALLLAGWRAAGVDGRFRVAGAVLATAGHALLVGLVVLEARGLALDLPAPPPAGDAGAFADYQRVLYPALAIQEGRLATVTTVVLGAWAALLVGLGFAARSAFHRWLGLALFALALGKVLLLDVWRLSRLEQVAVFLAVGLLMLAAAFLYARFGKRILGILRGADPSRPGPGPGPGPAGPGALLALLAAGGLGAAAPCAAVDAFPYREIRPVGGVDAPGLWAFELDADLYRRSLASARGLADLRIEGPGGAEAPWALRDVSPAGPETVREAQVVDPAVYPGGEVRAVLDLGRAGVRHDEIRLDLEGDDFLRAVRVETSADGRRFGVLREGARVWAVKDVPEARRTWVRHPSSDARWLRVTILPGPGAPPRITAAQAVHRPEVPPEIRSLDLGAPVRRAGPDGKTSLLDLDLGAPGLPVSAAVLEVATPAFERTVRVLASADGAYFVPVSGGVVWRSLPGSSGDGEDLRVEAAGGGRRYLRIEVRDGDAGPLDVRGVRVEWRAQEIVFRAEAAGAHAALLGDRDARPPSYDLGAVLARTPQAAVFRATLGPPGPNPRYAPREAPRPFTERHRVVLGAGLLVLLGALALWAVRLLRAGPDGRG